MSSFSPRVATLAMPALVAGFLSSCSVIGLKKHIETLESRGGITIQIVPPPKGPAPTYALAWRMENGTRKDSAGFHRVRADGIASFHLSMGSFYRVGAFTDENGNGSYDAGEPLAFLTDIVPIPITDPNARSKIRMVTLKREHGLPAGTVIRVPKENKELGGHTNIALGDVVSLGEKRFAAEQGGSGLWRPLDFLSGNALGLYFTEPYDAKRTPVIFVYGIAGSPQDWRYFIEHFDRSHHQLWFFHYPSGMRLDRVSGALAMAILELKHRHGFKRCDVVAHSMGGLVARTALCRAVQDEGVNFIPKFVSISTPWGGHRAAESGIRHLKKPVPSWLDVKPDSEFLLRMYATPLPKGTTHDLIYGSIKGGPIYIKGENDGVVTVVSETDPRIKKSTSSFRHFLHDHMGILQQPETLNLVEQLLAN
ncbi:MAG: putative lipase [Verrucomicrobiaceae bacterium]|nr:putative lipase [Verrucomicrobiaceae bacterium]